MQQKVSLANLAGIRYIDPEQARFYLKGDHFLCLDYEGETYENIKLHRSIPFQLPDDFISVQDMDSKEIFLIRSLYQFSSEQATLLGKQLHKRYYSPTISRVYSIKPKMGYLYFDVETSAGRKVFALGDVTRNLRRIDDGARIIIIDVDGNRYLIEDVARMAPKDFRRMEPYLL